MVSKASQAIIIVVTNNASSGTGSLREAIQIANANGITDRDYIYFDIPAATASEVSISLDSELPILTSNVVIDGTTQPISLLGNTGTRIRLNNATSSFFSGIRLEGSREVEIYGIEFVNFKSDPNGPIEDKKAGIYLRDSHFITIGSSSKPNCFTGSYAGILSPFIIPRLDVTNIIISGNNFGFNANGLLNPNESSIDLSFLKNSRIGGSTFADANVIAGSTRNGIALGGADGDVEISNNIIGMNRTMTTLYKVSAAVGIYVNGNASKPIISKNFICGQDRAVFIDYVNGGFVLEGNKLGVNETGATTFGNNVGVYIKFCNAGLIGGNTASASNEIAYNTIAVIAEIAYPISVLHNSIYCNSNSLLFINLPSGKTITTSKIANISANEVRGTYLPNSKIELFYTDACVNCEGKEWIATILTDGLGNWSYNGTIDLTRSITSMGTNQDGATAPFSKPLMDQVNALKTDVICNQPTGSIRGIVTYDASIFEWRDANGLIVGTAKDLEGVGPGTYRLTAKQNNSCSATSNAFTITSSGTGISENNKEIVKAYCGQSNGAITGIVTPNNVPRIWYNEAGVEVGRSDDLTNVPAGTYYFKAQLGTCNISSPNYVVDNVTFEYKIAEDDVKEATCSQDNGSISINTFQGARPDYIKWFNESNVEVGNSETISGLAAGRYRLMGYSNFGCSNLIKEYTIAEIQSPMVNLQNLKQYINCDGKSVSTSGIQVDGQSAPYGFAWVDQNQNIVASTLNLKNIPIGKYLLKVTDRYGCIVQSSIIDFTQLEETIVKIPNTFTPNGDSINDVWEIKGIENYPEAEFNIFNRSGATIFTSRGYSRPFDGTFNGKELPVGVYYYKINLNTECGVLTGSLTIIR